jgi:hypothetical protein
MTFQTARIRAEQNALTSFGTATLVSESAGQYVLDDQGYQLAAIVAFSCIIKPVPGDLVLYADTDSEQRIIVAIVHRAGDQAMALEFPANACFSSKTGSINLASASSISMSAPKLNTFSETQVQKADELYLHVREMHAQGNKLNANFENIAIFSKFISTMARQVINKFTTYLRHSEQFDQVKSANMTRSAEGLYALNSKQTVMLSEKDTKIDAERIHIG